MRRRVRPRRARDVSRCPGDRAVAAARRALSAYRDTRLHVILGGLGTAFGALVGSLVVGIVTEMSTLWFSTELKFVWALFIMALVLLLRPQGILGVKERIG